MKNILISIAAVVMAAFVFSTLQAQHEAHSPDGSVDVASFDDKGNLVLPEHFDDWVFIGTSLAMDYSQTEFSPDNHNMFQVVRIEPTAYAAFKETGKFVDGTMIALHFFGSATEVSNNRGGFVMTDLHMAEIHYKDSEKYPDGFNFFTFGDDDTVATEVGLPNDCVACHKRDAAYDGVFVQFYPTIHEYLPEAVRAELAQRQQGGDQHGMQH